MVRRRTRRTRQRPNIGRIRRSINRADVGVKITPPVDPPEYTPLPWWPLTLRISHKIVNTDTGDSITPAILTGAITSQTGVKGAFNIRLLTARVWSTAAGQPIGLSVNDSIGDISRWRTLADSGTLINYSRVGWRFGNIFSNISHLAASKDELFRVWSPKDQKVLIMVQILLCSNSTIPTTMFAGLQVDDSKESSKSIADPPVQRTWF